MKKISGVISLLGILGTAAFFIYGLENGIFYDVESLRQFIGGFGKLGIGIFILFQAVQVVVPILPGGIGCLGGVILYGAWWGFCYNYLGICLGSAVAFLLARRFGKPILEMLFREELRHKYQKMVEHKNFQRMFAVAIFLPVAPDDFLCYLAGTTSMRFRKFAAVILLGKPLAIAAYSFGLTVVFDFVAAFVLR